MVFNRPLEFNLLYPVTISSFQSHQTFPKNRQEQTGLTLALPLVAGCNHCHINVVLSQAVHPGLHTLIFIPIMLATYLASGITNWWQNKKYKTALTEAKTTYRNELREIETRLTSLKQEQQSTSRKTDPDLKECLRWGRKHTTD